MSDPRRYNSGKLIYGGVTLGVVAKIDFRPGIEVDVIRGEEFAGRTVGVATLESYAVLGCILRGWDDVAVSALVGGSAGVLVDPAAEAGVLQAGAQLVVEPDDADGVRLTIYNAVALVGSETGIAFSKAEEFGIPAIFIGEATGSGGATNELRKIAGGA